MGRLLKFAFILSLALNFTLFAFLAKWQNEIRTVDSFYAEKKKRLQEEAESYDAGAKAESEKHVAAIRQGIAELGIHDVPEKPETVRVVSYYAPYSSLYATLGNRKYHSKGLELWLEEIALTVYGTEIGGHFEP